MSWFRLALGLALLALKAVCEASCLENAIPFSQRQDLTRSNGESYPVGLWINDYPAGHATSAVVRILIEERLGYKVVEQGPGPGTLNAFYALLGCTSPLNLTDRGCGAPVTYSHINMETWAEGYANEWNEIQARFTSIAPINAGSMGYVGKASAFIPQRVREQAYFQDGTVLDFFRGWNVSWSSPWMFFDSLDSIERSHLLPCNQTRFMISKANEDYLRYTGDVDGVQQTASGELVAVCPDGFFWLPPACRNNPAQCVPYITGGLGWGLDEIMQKATAHGLPLAVAVASSWQVYTTLPLQATSAFFWWVPDPTFLELQPVEVKFPAYDFNAWALGDKRTQFVDSPITKLVSHDLFTLAPRVEDVVRNVRFHMNDLNMMMQDQKDTGDTFSEAACRWLRANEMSWESWLPDVTKCFPGFGLYNTKSEQFAESREDPTHIECRSCISGRYSSRVDDSKGFTYLCKVCEAGTFQAHHGETVCSQCEAGFFTSVPGLSACEACQLGSFANASGMTKCQPCGSSEQWTTSQLLTIHGEQRWIEVQAASNESLCHCAPGWFLDDGVCRLCSEGAVCAGSNDVELLPGFYSSSEDPGSVFKCHGDASRCPGGRPGTCAFGRDPSSVTCGACLSGLRPSGATCSACSGGDYAIFVLVGFLVLGGTGMYHMSVLKQNQSIVNKQSGLLNANLYLTQLVVCLQLVIVIQKIDITWDEPFVMLMQALSFLSLDSVFQSVNAISCVTRLSSTLHFLMQALAVPTMFLVAPVVIHFAVVLFRGREGLQLHFLCETLGSLSVLFFIVLCTAVVEPFQCQSHPNGLFTMQSSKITLCNFRGTHYEMCLMGGFLGLLPISFLTFSSWVVLSEFPKRLSAVDVRFTRACSFLVLRFRPGFEAFCIFTLARNALFALAPILPAPNASLLIIHVLICLNMLLVAYFKPWRSALASQSDLLSNAVFLIILFLGGFFVTGVDRHSSMVTCTIFLAGILATLGGLSIWAVCRHLLMLRTKKFHFFVSHHKQAAGDLARLMKIALQQRGFSVFLDTDNLNDLTQLFVTLSRNVEVLVVLGSPQVLTRKWCVAEMVTARLSRLDATLLMLPKFHLPAVEFIDAYEGAVPDIAELASYGFGIADITETLRWLRTIKTVSVSPQFVGEELVQVVAMLTGGRKPRKTEAFSNDFDSDFMILADFEDMEAVASAHVLRHFMSPHVLTTCSTLPKVLCASDRLKNHPADLSAAQPMFLVLLCTPGCLTAPCMIKWMLQAYRASSSCRVLPVIAADGFQVPQSSDAFDEIAEHPNVRTARAADMYTSVLKAIFMQIAVHFLPKSISETGLELKARQIVARLDKDSSANMSSLLDLSWFPSLQLGNFGTDRSDCDFPSEQRPADADMDEDLRPMPVTENDLEERYF